MTETGWQAIGRVAKARREKLGLLQEDLSDYGGPKVATVGKFERAAQDRFPLRTQQQMEKALAWSRGTIDDFVQGWEEGHLGPQSMDDWTRDLIEDNLPDLTAPRPAEADNRFEQRVESLRAVLGLIPDDQQDEAARAGASAMLEHVKPKLSVVEGRKEASVAAHDEDVPIERGQEYDEHP